MLLTGRLQTREVLFSMPLCNQILGFWHHLLDVDKTQSVSNNTSEDDGDASVRDFGENVMGVILVLIMMDVLLVLHRLLNLFFDVRSLSTCPSRPNVEGTPSGVNSPNPDIYATAMTVADDTQNAIRLERESRIREEERTVGSQSQHSSSSRDHRTCCRGDVVELTQSSAVVVICVGVSMFAVLPVAVVGGPTQVVVTGTTRAVVGGPTQAGVLLSGLVLPSLPATVLPVDGPVVHRRGVDVQRSSTDIHRQHTELELRQLLALRQLHGTVELDNQCS